MKQVKIKSKYNIKFNLSEVISYDKPSVDKNKNEVPIDTDLSKWKVSYYTDAQYIKGIVETTTMGNVKFHNQHNKASFSEKGELQLERRSGDEINTDVIMGYFEYTRSVRAIDRIAFNEFPNYPDKSKKMIYKNVLTLIEQKLDQEKFESFKKSKH
ncbi:MAG: hypothetical protein HND39_15150 [Ignavibacteriota bacterium]|jgi:hypothetical protein|nr:hypothetical protein [Ignavibacteriales bacterium]MBL1123543.1 hypothetical protein [Ignavibacteriota bacterium]MCC7094282.1 hypothetical protein [Ignavibacteriaceae bacterium]MCE7856952.1 hypothetical protein [Ignavibacteria bacterium CHB3]MEB2296266.1 hypothetical protein [Ignavibacteria bacterium]